MLFRSTLFHYTTANGLLGILRNNEIWSTAYYCANDESELGVGKGVLTPLFLSKTHEMIRAAHPQVRTFSKRGVDIRHYADQFEQRIVGHALSLLCVYITCFCKPINTEDFTHGLLSQWRGYGVDGGYALQFSRKKLEAAVERTYKTDSLNYDLLDVHYTPDNPLKVEVLKHSHAYTSAFLNFLDELENFDFNKTTMQSPIANLPGGPLESLLNFLVHTKSQHFVEERECRLSLVEPVASEIGGLPVDYFNRNGLIVPFTRTPSSSFNVLDCIEWIIIGPGPRIGARFNSITQMVRKMGLKIKVRPSHIPFSRV